jgi:hypothetical protein
MKRILTAELLLQGMSLSSFGADAYRSGFRLDHQPKPERGTTGDAGIPAACR